MFKSVLFFLLLASCLFAQPDYPSANSCAECHEEIFKAWNASRHANASLSKDLLYQHMFHWALEESQGKLKERCTICHSPLSTVFNAYDPELEFNLEGVNCTSCHGVKSIRAIHSARDLELDFSTIYSAHPEPENEAHPVAHRDYFQESKICLPCHSEMKNIHGIFACDTGNEWQQYFAVGKKHCQDCHMPQVNGAIDHSFPIRRPQIQSVRLDLQFAKKLKISLTNIGAGHALPTGTPLRMLVLKVTAKDSSGNVVWQNWETNPMKEDTSAVFMKMLADSTGRAPSPPWRATQIKRDRRLWPGQIHSITYDLPPETIEQVEARLFYHLAPPPILKRFKITAPEFTQPHLLAQQAIRIE